MLRTVSSVNGAPRISVINVNDVATPRCSGSILTSLHRAPISMSKEFLSFEVNGFSEIGSSSKDWINRVISWVKANAGQQVEIEILGQRCSAVLIDEPLFDPQATRMRG